MHKSPEKKIHFEDDQRDFFVTFLEKKLNNKSVSKENKEFYERCRDTYIEALKNKPLNTVQKPKEEAHSKLISKEHDKEVRFETICDISNFIYFCNIFSNASKRNDFKENFDEIKSSLHLESYPDFDIFAEFYQRVFDFTISKSSVKQQLEKSINELEHYVNGSQNIALRQNSYHNLLHTVDKVMSSQYFGNNKDRRPSMSLNLTASGKKLAHAVIDKPFHGEGDQNADQKKEQHKFSTKSPAFKPAENPNLPEELNLNSNDGFIEVQPKYVLVKKSKQYEGQEQQKFKHPRKPKSYHKSYNEDRAEGEQEKEERGQKKYIQKKIYMKKQEN